MHCDKCGYDNADSAITCGLCGASLGKGDIYGTGIQLITKKLIGAHRIILEISAWLLLLASTVGGYIAYKFFLEDLLAGTSFPGVLLEILTIFVCFAFVFLMETFVYSPYCLAFDVLYSICVAKYNGDGKVVSTGKPLPLVRRLIQFNRFLTALSAWFFWVGGTLAAGAAAYILSDGESVVGCVLAGLAAAVILFLLESLVYPPYCVMYEALYRRYKSMNQ